MIANGFSRALVEISSDLSFSRKQSQIIPTPEIKILVVRLYIQIFQFLGHAMKWYQSFKNRVRAMLNKDFYDAIIEDKVADMKNLVVQIKQEAGIESQKDIKKISTDLEELRLEQRAGNNRLADQHANSNFDIMSKLGQVQEDIEKLLELGECSQRLFIASGQRILLAQGNHLR